jgi:hypothetical protein
MNKSIFNQKGALHLLLVFGILGLLGIIAMANLAPFRNNFLASLYPKDQSQAAEITRVFNIKDYGATPDDANDDTVAIQRAIDEADLNTGSMVFMPAGKYQITRLNLIHKDQFTIAGVSQTGTQLVSSANGSTGAVIDLTGANVVNLERFELTMAPNKAVPVGILFARSNARSCSHNTLNNVGIYSRSQSGSYDFSTIGTWTLAPVYVFGCDYTVFEHPVIYNGQQGKGALIITSENNFGATSTFTTIGTGVYPNKGYRLYQAEVHNFVYGALGSLVLRNISDLTYFGGPLSSFSEPNIHISSGGSNLHFYGTTLYSENDSRLGSESDPRQEQRKPKYNVFFADNSPVSDLIVDQSTCQHTVGILGGSSEVSLSKVKINCHVDESSEGYLMNFSPSTNPARIAVSDSFFMSPYNKIKPPASIGANVTFVNPGAFEMPAGSTNQSIKIP